MKIQPHSLPYDLDEILIHESSVCVIYFKLLYYTSKLVADMNLYFTSAELMYKAFFIFFLHVFCDYS